MDYVANKPIVYRNKEAPDTNLERFQKIIEKKHKVKFDTYWELHKWTVDNYTTFLEELWDFLGIISSKRHTEVLVKTGPGFLDNEWFRGARLNYAENMLRIRDDTIALICLDETGNEDIVTYAEMFEEVKLYAAAFRRNGLKVGDTVACFMSNRKEAIFAMLAAVSIGAIWGGPVPFFGATAASNIIQIMDPKFLITVDRYEYHGQVCPMMDYLPEIANNVRTLEKVILVVTHQETRKKDLSNIRNCVFLENFLDEGRMSDGKVPDIIFEQLPFDHPLTVSFTSGTTGLPKAAVHSLGSFLTIIQDHSLARNMRKGDVFCTYFPVGWTLWDSFTPCFALGLTCFLFCGSVFYTVNGKNFWDLLAKYKVKMTTIITSIADRMEKENIIPRKINISLS